MVDAFSFIIFPSKFSIDSLIEMMLLQLKHDEGFGILFQIHIFYAELKYLRK